MGKVITLGILLVAALLSGAGFIYINSRELDMIAGRNPLTGAASGRLIHAADWRKCESARPEASLFVRPDRSLQTAVADEPALA
ncbi:MAG: hypothetical protein WCB49_05900 [Gammaproteobacteria bacterium]